MADQAERFHPPILASARSSPGLRFPILFLKSLRGRIVRVFTKQGCSQQPLLLLEEVPDRAVAIEQDAPLGLRNRLPWPGRDPPGELGRPREQLVIRVDGADDSHAECP